MSFWPDDLAAEAALEKKSLAIWGSPGGKSHLAERLVRLLPGHETYVEPFADSAVVLFTKEPAHVVEVINDADSEIAEAFRAAQRITPADIRALRAMQWTASRRTFERLKIAQPRGRIEKLHRFLYLRRFSYGGLRESFSANAVGKRSRSVDRVEKLAPRLRNVRIYNEDYAKVVRKYDGPNTVFYFDPPYVGHNADLGESDFDEERFFGVLKSIKGKFLLTYGVHGELPAMLKDAGFCITRMRTLRTIRYMQGVGGPFTITTIVATNFAHSRKALDNLAVAGIEVIEGGVQKSTGHRVQIVKAAAGSHQEERITLGIVLEPETRDYQGDIYSESEVEKACDKFGAAYARGDAVLSDQHGRTLTRQQAELFQNYCVPFAGEIGVQPVKKGTWMQKWKYHSDELWADVKSGRRTGFSIGGSAKKTPVPSLG